MVCPSGEYEQLVYQNLDIAYFCYQLHARMLSSWLGVTEELAATPFLSSEELQMCLQQLFFSYANTKLYRGLLYVTVNN